MLAISYKDVILICHLNLSMCLYQILDDQSFYSNACISGKCSIYGNLSFLGECMHESSDDEFGQILVDFKKIKNVEYA